MADVLARIVARKRQEVAARLGGGPVEAELLGEGGGRGPPGRDEHARQRHRIRPLELDRSPAGAVLVDAFGRTSLPGVSAAGDTAQAPGMPMPAASVAAAIASGQFAAATLVGELASADAGRLVTA